MSSTLKILGGHLNNIGKEIAKIDDFITGTENIPCDELIKKHKKREDLLEVGGLINHMINVEQQPKKQESPIIQM